MGDETEEIKTLTQHQLAAIVWPLRSPKEPATYIEELIFHIQTKFNEPSPIKFSRELEEFSSLRNIAISLCDESSLRDASGLKVLKRYYYQLSVMLNRFKDCGAKFSWKDSFGRNVTTGDLEFELNNIMYNIAAVHNELGAKIPRTNESATKDACLHFSSASWWVTELRDCRAGVKPKEIGHDMLTFLHHVLKAQAQECILVHSLRTGMKPENVSRIAAQIATDYEVAAKLALSPLYTDPIKEILKGGSLFQGWKATVEFKLKYFQIITQLLLGLSKRDDDSKEIGIRIARLRYASQLLEPCKKLSSDTVDSQTTKLAFATLEALVSKKLDKAIRYNDNVYHAQIPARESLPAPAAMLLISAVPFQASSIPECKDSFSSLVTIESVQTNSIYSQKKDDLCREMSKQVEQQDEELAQMMSTLNFEKNSLKVPSLEAPDDLVEICAELGMNPTVVDDVLTKLEEIDDKSEEIQNMLDSAQNMLRRYPNAQYAEELNRLRTTHVTALTTTQSLHKQLYPDLQKKIQLMASTCNPVELLPSVDKASSSDAQVIRELERLLSKVEEMKRQRASLLDQLKQSLNNDDMIQRVVAASSEHELKNVFDKEIQKHDKYLEPLQSNLKTQEQLLDQLERVNAQFGQVKLNYRNQQAVFKERVESLKKQHAQFKATSAGIDEGLRYQEKMLDLVKKFHAKVQAATNVVDLLN